MREARGGAPRWEGPRVTTAVKTLLGRYASFNLLAIVLLHWKP
jgi:hypothetical protein